jgi:hypothetical protein
MATNVTFGSLTSDLQNYLERGGSVISDQTVFNQIPRLINATERKLVQVLKLQGVIEVFRDPAGLQANNSIVSKPDRWRETTSMQYGAGADSNVLVPIYPRSYEYCRKFWPDSSATADFNTLDASNRPAIQPFYADYDLTHWLIVPTPAANQPLEVICYCQPQLLDSSNQTNFWTTYAPNALLYGALLEAIPFLKNDERIPVWKDYWTFEIQSLAGQDLQKIMDRSSERTRP